MAIPQTFEAIQIKLKLVQREIAALKKEEILLLDAQARKRPKPPPSMTSPPLVDDPEGRN